MSAKMTEDTLVQRTTADYLHDELGWESIFAYNEETFGPEGTLGRLSDKEVILTRCLGEALVKLNPGLPEAAYRSAISRITDYSFTQSPLQINREKYDLLKNGVPVEYRNDRGEVVKRRLRVFDFDRLRREFERSPRKNTTVQCLKTAIDHRLERMIQQNPLRTDFHKHYQEIITAYNSEKDRATIERTFEDLMKFVETLGEEEQRAIREGLDEESLALFDLLVKPELSKNERERIKNVAKDLLGTLKAEKLRIVNWPEKESTRSAVRVTIRDFLYNEATGLPVSFYTDEEVEMKTDLVYQHVFMQYRHQGYGAGAYV